MFNILQELRKYLRKAVISLMGASVLKETALSTVDLVCAVHFVAYTTAGSISRLGK